MDHPFLPILLVFIMAALFAGAFLGLSAILGPKKPNPSKLSVYECGLEPVGDARERFSVKFFLVAMLFILFDIEVVFLIPWAVLYKGFIAEGMGLFMLIEMGIFMAILAIGLLYVWRKGGLEWK
ncbi:MAG: NADH-quinone oxidoreductase subunit A [Deltaproteobacteria bacterium]|nr:NADH-quinone oxidoreductase subunit A [Deltaproteobacteria bacterium]